MRKVLLVTSFFAGTYGFVAIIILFIISVVYSIKVHSLTHHSNVIYAAIPNSDYVIDASIEEGDGRVDSVRNFLNKYHSELADYAEIIVNTADRYKVDYKLLPAIAMQESTGCKAIPYGSHNCWGFGIYGTTVTKFDSYADAIETVTKAMGEHYVKKGLDTPNSIMPIYTPPSKGSWSRGVTFFTSQMQ